MVSAIINVCLIPGTCGVFFEEKEHKLGLDIYRNINTLIAGSFG